MALDITETHKRVLKILSIPENDFRLISVENKFSSTMKFSNYAHELLNNDYLSGKLVERGNREYYHVELTDAGREVLKNDTRQSFD